MTFEQATIIQNDALRGLREIPDNYLHTCVTSPPYYGLRDYKTPHVIWDGHPACEHLWSDRKVKRKRGKAHGKSAQCRNTKNDRENPKTDHGQFCTLCGAWCGELGHEPTPELYIAHLVQIFREARRALHPSGTLWVVIGDSYNGSGGAGGDYNEGGLREGQPRYPGRKLRGMKAKDLIGIPWMLGLALRKDGWYLRSDIIWYKKNAMPEPVQDRPSSCHEYLLLLAKSNKYFYDAVAVREESTERPSGNNERLVADGTRDRTDDHLGSNIPYKPDGTGRNRRDVWTVNTRPYPDAHYAIYPPELVEPCILAGTSKKGCCPKCRAPWERTIDKKTLERYELDPSDPRYRPASYGGKYVALKGDGTGRRYSDVLTKGWRPTCKCEKHTPVPCTVADPFSGTGTTGEVAVRKGRHYIGIELSKESILLQKKRLAPYTLDYGYASMSSESAVPQDNDLFAGILGVPQ